MIILIFPLVGFNVLKKTNVQCNVNLCNYIVCKYFLFENFAYLFVICTTSTINKNFNKNKEVFKNSETIICITKNLKA